MKNWKVEIFEKSWVERKMKIKINKTMMLSKEFIIRRDHWQINDQKMNFLKRKEIGHYIW